MARPFSFSHEGISTFREEHKAAVVDLEYLIEAGTRAQISIEQDIVAIEELLGEQDVLLQQMDQNEEKLTDPDIVVTAADVEVSEECYRNVCYRLGEKAYNTIRFSNESTYNAVSAEPRRYLAMSQEGIGDFIKKIWEKIKAFFRKIGEKLGLVGKAQEAKVESAATEAAATVEAIKQAPEQVRASKISEIFAKLNPNEIKNLEGLSTVINSYNVLSVFTFVHNYDKATNELVDIELYKKGMTNLCVCVNNIKNVLGKDNLKNFEGIVKTINDNVKSIKLYPAVHSFVTANKRAFKWTSTRGGEVSESDATAVINKQMLIGTTTNKVSYANIDSNNTKFYDKDASVKGRGDGRSFTTGFSLIEGTLDTSDKDTNQILMNMKSCRASIADMEVLLTKISKLDSKQTYKLKESIYATQKAIDNMTNANPSTKGDDSEIRKEMVDLLKFISKLAGTIAGTSTAFANNVSASQKAFKALFDVATKLDKSK